MHGRAHSSWRLAGPSLHGGHGTPGLSLASDKLRRTFLSPLDPVLVCLFSAPFSVLILPSSSTAFLAFILSDPF
jgi:hypothetical protein